MKFKLMIVAFIAIISVSVLPLSASSIYEADPGFVGGRDMVKISNAQEFTEFYEMNINEQLEYVGTNIVKLVNVRYYDATEYENLYEDVMSGDVSGGEATLTYAGDSIVDGSVQKMRLRVIYTGSGAGEEIPEQEAGFYGGETEVVFYDKDEFEQFYDSSADEQLMYLGTDIVNLKNVEHKNDEQFVSLYEDVQAGKVYEGEAYLEFVGTSTIDGNENMHEIHIMYFGEKEEGNVEQEVGFLKGREEYHVYSKEELNNLFDLSIEEQLEYLGIMPVGLENLRYDNLDEYQQLNADVQAGKVTEGEATVTFVGNSIYDGSEFTKDVKVIYTSNEL